MKSCVHTLIMNMLVLYGKKFWFVDDFVVDSILDSKRVERMMEIYEAEFFLGFSTAYLEQER